MKKRKTAPESCESLIKEGGLVCRRTRSVQANNNSQHGLVHDAKNAEPETKNLDLCNKVPIPTKVTEISTFCSFKTCTDSIHGQIELPALCVRILNTPEMQRLHRLKQLGVCDYVFRCANHTRLEHSIGVAHCANVLISNLQEQYRRSKNQRRTLHEQGATDDFFCPPKITEADKLCVLVASLCHDLGHGPFSHQFEGVLSDLKVVR